MAGDADRTVALWRQLASVQRRVNRDLDRSLRETLGYPANWIDTLMALAGAPERRQPMKDLALQLGMTRSGLSSRGPDGWRRPDPAAAESHRSAERFDRSHAARPSGAAAGPAALSLDRTGI